MVVIVVVFFTVVVVVVELVVGLGLALVGRAAGFLGGAVPSLLSAGFVLGVGVGLAENGFFPVVVVFGVGFADEGLAVVVFGALFGGPPSFTS